MKQFDFKLFTINSAEDLIHFFSTRNIPSDKIPIRKIFHSILKKESKVSILEIKYNPNISIFKHYESECNIYGSNPNECFVFHFFSGIIDEIKDETDIEKYRKQYRGYCIPRPDWSICHSLISCKIIIRDNDTYAYLVSRLDENIKITQNIEITVIGFPYIEKDGRGVMCSQASLGIICEYWNHNNTKYLSFSNNTAIDINTELGIPESDMNRGKGLSIKNIDDFCKKNNVPCIIKDFSRLTVDMIRKQRPETDIYGFVDSKFPVCCVVKAGGEYHALTIIGHTFDRNVWHAMADLYYYKKPLSGDGIYHSNLTWVRNFIIQDDNFGPYFFLPWDKLPEILVAYIIPLPNGIKTSPLHAERIAVLGIRQIIKSYIKIANSKEFHIENKFWAEKLLVKSDEGLVMRPIFINKEELLNQYKNRPFYSSLHNILDEWELDWYAAVEISWPDIYCYQRINVGLILLDPSKDPEDLSKEKFAKIIPFIHLPGAAFFRHKNSTKGEIEVEISSIADKPSLHFIPSKQHNI